MWREGNDHIEGHDWIGPEHKEDLGNGSYIAYYQNVGILTEKNKSALEVLDENEILQTRLLGRNSPLSEDSKTFLNNRANNRVLSELGREVGLMVTMELAGMGAGKIIGQIEKWAWVLFGKGAVKGGANVLTKGEILCIENAATRINKPINVIGSRATGKAGPYSDWDYVIESINSRSWNKIKNYLPGSKSILDNTPKNIDLFKGPLDPTKPYIIINPRIQ